MSTIDLRKTPRARAVLDEAHIWRTPPFDQLRPAYMTTLPWLSVLRGYLIFAGSLVLWRIVDLAISIAR